VSKANELRALAESVALEIENAEIRGSLTFEEFVAVLGRDWLDWIPENDGGYTIKERYDEFVKALANYRSTGNPFLSSKLTKSSPGVVQARVRKMLRYL